MKKQMFLALILLCAGISLNAMTNDMEKQEETKSEEAATAMPAPVKEEVAPVAPEKEEVKPAEEAEEDFEIDLTDEEVEE